TSGIETAYYRPLTICLYAERFAVLGLNARANHAASLLLFVVAATLFAVFVAEISGTALAGLIAATAFVVHPGMPYSAVAWVTNQMHLADLIVVLAALISCFQVRSPGPWWWIPLVVFQAGAFMIKEDGVMLIPTIVALHILRKYIAERDLPHAPWAFLLAASMTGVVLLFVRSSALAGVPPHRLPSFDQALTNWTRAFNGAFRLVPAKRPWQSTASWCATLAPLAAIACWRLLSRPVRFALAAGVALALLFELPFAYIVKPEQLHVVATGAALTLTAAITGLLQAASRWRVVA